MVAIRAYYFVQNNPPALLGKRFTSVFIYKLMYALVDQWSQTMFWVSFFLNMYWFVMFKMQDNAYILLPTTGKNGSLDSAYDFFFAFYIVILITKTIAVFMRVMEQSRADIFIMDWEKPKFVA